MCSVNSRDHDVLLFSAKTAFVKLLWIRQTNTFIQNDETFVQHGVGGPPRTYAVCCVPELKLKVDFL